MRIALVLLVMFGLAACSGESGNQQEKPAAEPSANAEPEAVVAEAVEQLESESVDLAELDEGAAYLHINAQKPGVQVLESGLQFEILEQGDGATPGPTSRVVTHYEGKFIDGQTFDSSIERGEPASFPVDRVIKGWTEALQMMKEGDVWRLVIPAELAYGERGVRGTIPPNSVLVFEVELIEVLD